MVIVVCIVCLAALLALAVVARRRLDGKDIVETTDKCASCTSGVGKCAMDCMAEATVKPIEYYGDEDLDRYRGRASDAYSDDEAEEFRYVLYTMRPDEAEGWSRSLAARGISAPDQIKDELMLLMSDGQSGKAAF